MSACRNRRKESLQTLMDAGLLQPVKRGRPPIYENDDDRLAALKKQKKDCSQRYGERIKNARALLKESVRLTADVNNASTI